MTQMNQRRHTKRILRLQFVFDFRSLQSIPSNDHTETYASLQHKIFEGISPSHQTSHLHNFIKYSPFFSAMQIYFGEVPRTQHWRQHSLWFCMDYFSLCALATNQSILVSVNNLQNTGRQILHQQLIKCYHMKKCFVYTDKTTELCNTCIFAILYQLFIWQLPNNAPSLTVNCPCKSSTPCSSFLFHQVPRTQRCKTKQVGWINLSHVLKAR